jgi:vancomycin resistance protein VanJ
VFADEPHGLIRSILPASDVQADSAREASMIRVVTANCSSDVRAVEEAAALSPDILLVQESPAEQSLLILAASHFDRRDGVAHGGDVAVLAKGSVQVRYASRSAFGAFIHCTVHLNGGRTVDVIGLRLSPPTVRLDLWSPDCWRAQAAHRQRQRNELAAALELVTDIPPDRPIIVAGDFNAPAGDAIFSLLGPQLKDSFREAGRGWGNTITSKYPFHRIDQIWTSDHLTPIDGRARPMIHSDHRLVVAELSLNSPPP